MEEISRERAQTLMREGDLDGAVAVLKEVTAQNPGDAMAWQLMGGALGALGNADESIGAFQQAAELQPTSARVQFNLAVALIKSDRNAEARSHLEKALALDPGYEQARTRLKELGGIAPDTVAPPPPDPTLGGGAPAAKPAAPAPAPPPPAAPAPAPASLGGIGAPAAPKPAAPAPPAAPAAAPAGISLTPIGGGLAPIGGAGAASTPAAPPPAGAPAAAPGGMAGMGAIGGGGGATQAQAAVPPPPSAAPMAPPPSMGPGGYSSPGAGQAPRPSAPSSYSGPAIDAPPSGGKLVAGIGLALLFGFIGCAIWWAAVYFTGFIAFRALIAIGIGWLIGYGVKLGVGQGGATQAATAAIIAGITLVPNMGIMLLLAPGIVGGIFSVLGVAWGIQQAYKVAGSPD